MQGLAGLDDCEWAYINLKTDKVLIAETPNESGQPLFHCVITDLGSAIRTGGSPYRNDCVFYTHDSFSVRQGICLT